MKKILILIVLFVLGGSVSFADSLGDISASFCGRGLNGHALNFAVQAGIPYEFCIQLSTTSTEKTVVSLGFVDGEVTNDALHNKACSSAGSLFAPYVDFPANEFTLTSGSIIQKTGVLLFPLGYSGAVHGCLVYSIPKKTSSLQQGGSLFNVLVRKANFIDGYVAGDFVRHISFLSKEVLYYRDKINNDLVISLPFVSSGMIPEFFQFTGILDNSLGYRRSVSSFKTFSGSSAMIFRFSDIPFYEGKYTFSFQGSSVLDTSLDTSYLPEQTKQPISFSYTKTLFFIPRMLVFRIVGFVIVLFILRFVLKFVLRR